MAKHYAIYGLLGSPYSLKMRAVFRYRRIHHIWHDGSSTLELAKSKVKIPVIPVIEFPDGSFHNDSTPMIYALESLHANERSIIPADDGNAFLAALIEDFADEWLSKAMFGYRWLREVDRHQMSHWVTYDVLHGGGQDRLNQYANEFRMRQTDRLAMIGCTEANQPLIELTAQSVLAAIETHVMQTPFFFGSRPSLAEFSIFGQCSQFISDPTPNALMREQFPYAMRWLQYLDDVSGVEGAWDNAVKPLEPVVLSILRVAGEVYFPFLLANAKALQAGQDRFAFDALGFRYEQAAFKYQAHCFSHLRQRYAELSTSSRARIDPVLDEAGCLVALRL
jgi:glutathione S-transferase